MLVSMTCIFESPAAEGRTVFVLRAVKLNDEKVDLEGVDAERTLLVFTECSLKIPQRTTTKLRTSTTLSEG